MSSGGAMLNLIFGLAVVLGMLWLLLAGLRRVPALRGLMPASRGRVHASLAVGPRERVVLGTLLDGCIEEIRARHALPSEAVHLEVASDSAVRGNPAELSVVFRNLLENALGASEGAGEVHVTVARADGDGGLAVTVDDRGRGVSDTDLERIFEPYFSTSSGGTGLGLPIARRIVEEHGGTIEAQKRRRGAHLVIELPLEPILDNSDPWASRGLLASTPSLTAPA